VCPQPLVQARDLGEDADALANRLGLLQDVVTGDPSGAAIRAQQAGKDARRRGLAGAIWAKQAVNLPFADREADAGKRDLRP
jgi:hypothetical protein